MRSTPPAGMAPAPLPVAAGVAAAGVAASSAPLAPSAGLRAGAGPCDNCGAQLSGRYCGACGQRVEPPVHSLWHFTQVAFEDVTHADSRLWRTLAALLFKPGFLTREFLAGRRARYLPPVRLYLVLSVAFFIWVSAGQSQLQVVQFDAPQRAPPSARVTTPFDPALPGESAPQRSERLCHNMGYAGPWQQRLGPLLMSACRKVVEDQGRSLRESFLHNLPRAMFVFLPLLAGGMMLMYWRPRHYYIEHLLLFVQNHAFAFLLLLLMAALAALLPRAAAGWLHFAAGVYIVWYMYRSMRVVYGQGRALSFAKLVVLSLFYFLCGTLMLAIISLYSYLTV
jgi:uncharacterized protein DUF3667